jgi:hypothetical protein
MWRKLVGVNKRSTEDARLEAATNSIPLLRQFKARIKSVTLSTQLKIGTLLTLKKRGDLTHIDVPHLCPLLLHEEEQAAHALLPPAISVFGADAAPELEYELLRQLGIRVTAGGAAIGSVVVAGTVLAASE